jgi:hypothetical protein
VEGGRGSGEVEGKGEVEGEGKRVGEVEGGGRGFRLLLFSHGSSISFFPKIRFFSQNKLFK